MIFSSLPYLFLFLPISVLGYYLLGRLTKSYQVQEWYLILASLVFYGLWKVEYVALLLASIAVNGLVAQFMEKISQKGKKKGLLWLGILFNVGLIGYFKYTGFLQELYNEFLGGKLEIADIFLPLGISFFTFQQIAYLVDTYKEKRGKDTPHNWRDYMLFVTFFPQMIAGPIVHHEEMMPQFRSGLKKWITSENLAFGLFILVIGLGKKMLIADNLAPIVAEGFAKPQNLDFWSAWGASLAYTGQLYFDFSGYTDMAIGSARLFGIKLPENFRSPYIATSLRDFWRRWHMTLTRFLTQYIYFPLGGSKKGYIRTLINILIVFAISGIWHGAGKTFVLWGLLHGGWMVIERILSPLSAKLPKIIQKIGGWGLTFLFVNTTWVMFRAPSLEITQKIYKKMLDFSQFGDFSLALPKWVLEPKFLGFEPNTVYLIWGILAVLALPAIRKLILDSKAQEDRFRPSFVNLFSVLYIWTIAMLLIHKSQEFLYFQF